MSFLKNQGHKIRCFQGSDNEDTINVLQVYEAIPQLLLFLILLKVPMFLYALRHAEKIDTPVWNSDKKFDDRGINEHGKSQSLSLYDYFKDKNIQHVFVSEYARTLETILPFCRKTGITPLIDNALNEINVGSISDPSTPPEEVSRLLEKYSRFKNEETDFKYTDGESGSDVFIRIKQFLEKMTAIDENIVAVSHEGWIKLLVCFVLDIDPGKRFRLLMDTCGLVKLEREHSGWKIHFPGIADTGKWEKGNRPG